MASPAVSPSPGVTFNTPGGTPASLASSARYSALRDVSSAGFSTTEHPAAKAGANFQAAMRRGKFQGTTKPTTPTGSFTIRARASSPVDATLPKLLSINSAYHWKQVATSVPISFWQSVIVFPLSRLSITERTSAWRRIKSASRRRTSFRCSGAERDHAPLSNEVRAAVTALSMSSA